MWYASSVAYFAQLLSAGSGNSVPRVNLSHGLTCPTGSVPLVNLGLRPDVHQKGPLQTLEENETVLEQTRATSTVSCSILSGNMNCTYAV